MKLSDKIDWNDLRLLMILDETGRVSDAAARLNVDPTTITRRIRRVENKTGLKLLERVRGGVVFTDESHLLLQSAKKLERTLDDIFPKDISEQGLQGSVRISAVDFMFHVLAKSLSEFQLANPAVHLDIRESYFKHSLENQEVDIAIRMAKDPNEGLVGCRHQLKISIYGVESWREVKERGWNWVSWNLSHSVLDRWINEVDPRAKVVARSGSILSQAVLAQQGLGVVAIPDIWIERQPNKLGLVKIDDGWVNEFWVLTHEELRDVPRIKAVMDCINMSLRKQLPRL